MTDQTLVIPKIENGIVIDHIQQGHGIALLHVLTSSRALDPNTTVALGVNLPSTRLGRKDLVKIGSPDLPETVLAHISLVAPGATIKRIRGYRVEEKVKVTLPEVIQKLLKCPIPSCVAYIKDFPTRFEVQSQTQVKCSYCERVFELDRLERIF